jgi:hypothetical protein
MERLFRKKNYMDHMMKALKKACKEIQKFMPHER